MQINATYQKLLGSDFLNKLAETNILLIGVGGIGCEVLKVLSKFNLKSIHIIDLDTIEVSNLNRQFLFRKEHRGMYKAHVAKEVMQKNFPHLNIVSYNINIRDTQFGVKFFSKFQLVIMALDNQETRSYVNKLCMALEIPLLDAGTQGYKGQAFLLQRGLTRCYDCYPRDITQKTYPACTIRTFPEKPVHCIIWAKYLFGVLFGESDDSNMLEDLRNSYTQTGLSDFKEKAELIFQELYYKEIMKEIQSSTENSEKFKGVHPIDLVNNENFKQNLQKQWKIKQSTHGQQTENEELLVNCQQLTFRQQILSLEQQCVIFIQSCTALMDLKQKSGFLTFEKDDNLCIKFVMSAANLRAHVFNIPMQNEFSVKQISGRIVPAIASTNAIVAGIQVTEALKQFAKRFGTTPKLYKNRELYVQNDKSTKILDANPGKPNPNCAICNHNLLPDIVYCNFQETAFGQLIQQVIQKNDESSQDHKVDNQSKSIEDEESNENNGKRLKSFSIGLGENIIYEEGDQLEDDDEDNDEVELNQKKLGKTMYELFGNSLSDQRISVTNEDSGFLYRTYILVHDELKKGEFNIKEVEGDRKEVDLTKILEANNLNMAVDKNENNKEAEQSIKKKENSEKKPKSTDNSIQQISDDSEEIVFSQKSGNGEKNQQQQQQQQNGKGQKDFTIVDDSDSDVALIECTDQQKQQLEEERNGINEKRKRSKSQQIEQYNIEQDVEILGDIKKVKL